MKKSLLETDFERVQLWMTNPEAPELTENEKKVYDILCFCYNQLMHYTGTSELVIMLQRRYKPMSRATAFAYVRNTKNIFLPYNKVDKEFMLGWLVDKTKKVFEVALRLGDIKEANKSLEILIKHLGLGKEDSDVQKMEDLSPKQINIQLNIDGGTFQLPWTKLEEIPSKTIKEMLTRNEKVTDKETILKYVK